MGSFSLCISTCCFCRHAVVFQLRTLKFSPSRNLLGSALGCFDLRVHGDGEKWYKHVCANNLDSPDSSLPASDAIFRHFFWLLIIVPYDDYTLPSLLCEFLWCELKFQTDLHLCSQCFPPCFCSKYKFCRFIFNNSLRRRPRKLLSTVPPGPTGELIYLSRVVPGV